MLTIVNRQVLDKVTKPQLAAASDCKATHLLTGDIGEFGPVMNHPSLTNGIAIQRVCRIPPISGVKGA